MVALWRASTDAHEAVLLYLPPLVYTWWRWTTSRASAPDPEVPAKAQRRRFTTQYRLRILKEADACKQPGELGRSCAVKRCTRRT